MVKEIIWLNKKLGINELYITDDNFTHIKKRVEKICDLIIKNNLKISINLANGVRVDRLNESLLKKLKSAGCWFLSVSPESGNEESLKIMKK